MAVFRVNKTRDYTIMSNWHLKDRRLTLKAKGLLTLMLSLPDDWDYSISGLCAICVENESAIKSALDELKNYDYLKVTKKMPGQTSSGRIEYVYDIYEQSQGNQQVEKQQVENLCLENQALENQGQLNTNESNTKKSSTKNKKESKKETLKSFNELIEEYTDNPELQEALKAYIQMRRTIRKPLTNYAFEQVFKKLNKLAGTEEEKIEIVNQSIMNSWQGVFAVKDNKATYQPPQTSYEADKQRALEENKKLWANLPGMKRI